MDLTRAVRWLACVALAACAAPPRARPGISVAAPPASPIEPSPAEAKARPTPLDLSDPAVRRCLDLVDEETTGCTSPTATPCVVRCRAGETTVCRQIALAVTDGPCRRALLDLVCRSGELPACADLGEQLVAEPARHTKAAELLGRACDGHIGRACTALGLLYSEQSELLRTQDKADEKADEAFARACEQAEPEGCWRAGSRMLAGEAARSDDEHAIVLLARACRLDHAGACLGLAGLYLRGGHGLAQDQGQAEAILAQVCASDKVDDHGEACRLLAALEDTRQAANGNVGGPQPTARTLQLMLRACAKGHQQACDRAMSTAYQAHDYATVEQTATAVLAHDGRNARALSTRALTRIELGRFAGAAADLEILCPADPSAALRPDMWPYCHLWLFGARARSGQDAKAGLELAAPNIDMTAWPGPVVQHFLGKLSEQGVLAKARHPDDRKQLEQQCEAYYYIGLKNLIDSKTTKAIARFDETVATGITEFIEHAAAVAELGRLRP